MKKKKIGNKLACRDWCNLVDIYYDDELTIDELGLLKTHILNCENCAVYFHTYTKTVTICEMAEEIQIPTETRRQLWIVLHREFKRIKIK